LLKITNDVEEFKAEDECVVYFTAEWCGPCKQLKPQYAKASVIDSDTNYYMLDVDKISTDKLSYYGIQSIPQVFVMKKGEIAKTIKSRTADGIILEKDSVE
jgi:thioredoxin 1